MGCTESSRQRYTLPSPRRKRCPRLAALTLEGIADYISSKRCRRIIWLSGAGISVSAGIPDFRSPGTGLYTQLSRFNLPTPESIFDLQYFRAKSAPFYSLTAEMYPGQFKPTLTHHFIALLARKKKLLRNWSQNIDTLEHLAGIPPSQIVNAHGSFARAACIDCGAAHDPWETGRKVKEWKQMHERQTGDPGRGAKAPVARLLPRCRHADCGGLVKPSIILYGESLPDRFSKLAKTDFSCPSRFCRTLFQVERACIAQLRPGSSFLPSALRFSSGCDLLIVAGTSLAVQPFASLTARVAPSVPRLLINREVVGTPTRLDGGFLFGRITNTRDVMARGDCDATVRKLSRLLGWEGELDKLASSFSMSIAMKHLRAFGSGKKASKRQERWRRKKRKKARKKAQRRAEKKKAKKAKQNHDRPKKKRSRLSLLDRRRKKKSTTNGSKVHVDGDGSPTRVMRGKKKKLLGLLVDTSAPIWESSGPQMPSPAKRLADLPLPQLAQAPNCGM